MRAAFRVSHGVLTLPPSMIVRPLVPFIEYCILINSWVFSQVFPSAYHFSPFRYKAAFDTVIMASSLSSSP